MRVAILGGTGRVGREIVAEALRRGHDAVSITRGGGVVDGASSLALDVRDAGALRAALVEQRAEAVISALSPSKDHAFGDLLDGVIGAAAAAGISRVVVVGGAGSSLRADGSRVLDTIPDEWRWIPLAHAEALERMRAQSAEVDWVNISPAERLAAGPRTGAYRRGTDDVIVAPDGESHISFADLAIAVLDEVEAPSVHRARMTVGD